MNRLRLGLLVVVGLSAGLASTACTDQSGEQVYEDREQKTERGTKRDTEVVRRGQEPVPARAAEHEEISEEERRELQDWLDEKLREAQEQETEVEREDK